MCCNNRTHVIVISTICLIITGIAAMWFGIPTIIAVIHAPADLPSSAVVTVVVPSVIYFLWIASIILSICGACNNNSCLLVPFMICLVLQIIASIGFAIIIGIGRNSTLARKLGIGPGHWIIYIILLLVEIVLSIYFLAVTCNLCGELSSGTVHGSQPGMVLQTYAIPQEGVATNVHGYAPAYVQQAEVATNAHGYAPAYGPQAGVTTNAHGYAPAYGPQGEMQRMGSP